MAQTTSGCTFNVSTDQTQGFTCNLFPSPGSDPTLISFPAGWSTATDPITPGYVVLVLPGLDSGNPANWLQVLEFIPDRFGAATGIALYTRGCNNPSNPNDVSCFPSLATVNSLGNFFDAAPTTPPYVYDANFDGKHVYNLYFPTSSTSPPAISKAFAPNSIFVSGASTLTFTISNPNSTALTGIGFTDNLPAGIAVAATPNLTNSCGGAPSASSAAVSLSGGTLPANGTCTLSVTVVGTSSGIQNNVTGAVTSTEGGTGNTASAALLVSAVSPPAIAKVFNPSSIPLGASSTLTFTISNPNATSLTGIGFTDNLPAGVVVATPSNLTNTCGGTPGAGSSVVSLTGGALTANAACTIGVSVTGTSFGPKNNVTSPVTSNQGNGNSASATLTVSGPPSITKAFAPSSIPVGGTSTLTLTIVNPNPTPVTGIAFIDNLPAGLAVAATPNLTNTCGGVPASGSASVSLSGGSLPANGTCAITASVTGTSLGPKTNVTGVVTSTEGGNGNTASATLTMSGPPSISKAFAPSSISVGGNSTLTFTIANPNATTLTGIGFTDILPAGVVVAPTPNLTNTCGGSPNAGSTAVSLTGGTISAGGTCTVSVSVTASTSGTKNNVTSTVTSTEGGNGNTASATLTVTGPASIGKAFAPSSILVGGNSTLTFTISNPNSSTLTGIGFTDNLPAGVVVAATPNLTNTCGGGPSAASSSVSLTGGALPANGTCTISVSVTGTTSGTKNNVTSAVSSTEGGTGNTATATLTVSTISPPSIGKAFAPSSITVGGNSTLTFTIANPNTATLTGIGFTDNLPSGVVVATPANLTNTCGGSPNIGSTAVSLTGGTLPANGTCTISVSVTGSTSGTKNNVTGAVTSTEGGTGNTATATLSVSVVSPPSISKGFVPSSVPVGTSSNLTFTIGNPNATVLTGIGFTDNLPTGMTVAVTPNLSNSCGGSISGATANSTLVSLTGGTLPANGTCTVSVTVTGASTGTKNNVTSPVTSTEGGSGNTAAATLRVSGPPSISKVFAPSSISAGGTTTLTFTIGNPNAGTLTGVGFNDSFPAGMAVAANPNLTNTCGGTVSGATAGSTSVSLTGGAMAGGTCTFSVSVVASTSGTKNNVTSAVTSTEGGNGNTASAALTVAPVSAPSINKVFAPSSIAVGGASTLTFTISNPNATPLSGIGFSDSFPAGMTVAASPNLTNTCGGTINGVAANSTAVSLIGGTLAPNGTCSIGVSTTGSTLGSKNNVTSTVTSTEGGNGNTASATLLISAPPSIGKAFAPSSIPVSGVSTLTFTIGNPNATPLTGVGFTDNLPTGLVVAAIPGLTNSCGGSVNGANTNSTVLSLVSGTLGANGSCTISVSVTGSTAGTKNNVTSAITSLEGGNGNTASATLTVTGPASIGKAFAPSSVLVGGVSTLTFTISNPNATALSGIGFTDNLPAGMVVSTTPGLTNSCGGAVSGATANSTGVSLAGGTLGANGTCTISVSVTGTSAGTKNNVTSAVSSTEAGNGNAASATLTVSTVSPPSIGKAFAPSSISLGGNSRLTFTISNPNSTALTGVGFTDNLPAGVVTATTPALTNTCGGSPAGFVAGSTSVSLTGGTLAGNGTCTVSISVTGTSSGTKNNVTGAVTSTEGGNGNSASATLVIASALPPSIAKAFAPSSISVGGTSTLTFAIGNSNATALTGIGFTDNLPAGVTVAATPNLTNSCGGAPTGFGVGSSAVSLAAGTVTAGGNCTITVNVVGNTAGTKNNVTSAVTSSEGGTGNSAAATLTVSAISSPSISKAFAPSSIAVGSSSTLTFTIGNPNATALTGIGFSDSFPAGMSVATAPNLSNSCGGAISGATANSTGVSLAGGTVAGGGTCTVGVSITANTSGAKNNVTSAVTSTEGGSGNTASATLTVGGGSVSPPSIGKAFSPASIAVNGTSTLTFTISNPNTTPLTGISFADNLPAGMVVADAPNPRNSCGGAPSGYGPGSTAVSLSGGTIAASGSCNFSVNITGTSAGTKNNVTGAVNSTEGGNGNTASATLTVGGGTVSPPSIGKAFSPSSIALNGTSTLTFTVSNPNTTALTGIGFTDIFPSGLVVAAAPNLTNTCGGTVNGAAPNSITVSLAGGTLAASGTCAIRVNVTGTTAGTKNNVTSAIASTEGGNGNTASATLAVAGGTVSPPSFGKAFAPSSIAVNGTSTLTFTISNPNTTALTGVGFTDIFPSGLVAAAAPNLSNSCGGAISGATANSTAISLTGGTVAVGGTCTVGISITANTSGTKNNVTSAVTSTEGGNGNIAAATLTVGGGSVSPPSISKAFSPASIAVNGTSTLTFTISNPNTTPLTGISFVDNLPAGMVVADAPNPRNSCGGAPSGYGPGSTAVSLSGGTIAASGSCNFSVSITGTSAGTKNNVTSAVTSTEGGSGNTASATLTVGGGTVSPPSIGKAFSPSSIALNGTSTLMFTVSNPNTTALTGIGFTDIFPSGLVVVAAPNLTNTCGGTVNGAAPNSITVSLAGGTLSASGTCTIRINVTGTTAGTKNNITSAISSTEGGNGNTASATLAVAAATVLPPSIGKAFAPSSIALNGVSTLMFTISNPNTTALTGVGFTDIFPTGLAVAAAPNLTNSCGGTVSGATANSTIVSLANGTVGVSGVCTIGISVTGTSTGTKNNVTSAVTSTEGGNGNNAIAVLSVSTVLPPSIGKAFAPSSIAVNGISTLTFTLTNPNTIAATGIGFTDTFPTGLIVADTPNLINTCGGAPGGFGAGSATVSLAGGTVTANGSCILSVSVVGTSPGTKNNVTGVVTSTEGGAGNTASAILAVTAGGVPPPTIDKSFTPSSISLNGTSTLVFTISNPGTAVLTGIGFTDAFPAGLVVADPPNPRNTCGGSPSGYGPGSSTISLAGGSVAANGSCRFTVNVVGITPGTKNNVTGAVTSAEGGSGNTASATLVVSPVTASLDQPGLRLFKHLNRHRSPAIRSGFHLRINLSENQAQPSIRDH